jgi:hypothetical protein
LINNKILVKISKNLEIYQVRVSLFEVQKVGVDIGCRVVLCPGHRVIGTDPVADSWDSFQFHQICKNKKNKIFSGQTEDAEDYV